MRNIISRNPFSGKILQQIPFSNPQQINKQLQNARLGFELLSKHQTKQKISMLKDLAITIEQKKQQIAKMITTQTGKPIIESDFQVKQAIKICSYYAAHHEGLYAQNVKTLAKKKTLIKYLPLGTVYCVLPAIYPLLLNFCKTIPQLMLGNSVLVRHAHNTTGTAKTIEKIMKKVGFQSGQYQCVWHNYNQTEVILKNDNVVGVNFTGSPQNASKIAAIAGKHLKKYQMQIGQNNVLIVLADGNVQQAVDCILKPGYFNSGQGISPKILVVHRSLYQKLKTLLTLKLKQMKFGNPQSKDTLIGPIISPAIHQSLVKKRNELLSSSSIVFQRNDMNAPFFSPAVFDCKTIPLEIRSHGPLFQIFQFQQQPQIHSIVSKIQYVESICLFSAGKRMQAIQNLKAGNIFINTVHTYDIQVPLGGSSSGGHWKQGWQESIRNFANVKTNYIN